MLSQQTPMGPNGPDEGCNGIHTARSELLARCVSSGRLGYQRLDFDKARDVEQTSVSPLQLTIYRSSCIDLIEGR
jgi:hypothetical protein